MARGKDGILPLKADETFAPAQPLLAGGVEAGLSGSRAADGQPVPVEEERLAGSQHPPRLGRQANVEFVRIYATIVP
jgi:hypothetical protein